MEKQTIVIGLTPNPRVGTLPLEGSMTERRILEAAGLPGPLHRWVDVANLVDDPDYYNITVAKTRVWPMIREDDHHLRFVFLGSAARSVLDVEWLDWTEYGDKEVVVVPHPSGINRWYNDAGNRAKAEAFWRDVLR